MDSANRIEISKKALKHNFMVCQRQAGNAKILAMVKADAYGHGMIECAKTFANCGAVAFGVAEPIEGLKLRENGIKQPILVLAGTTIASINTLIEHNLTPVVSDIDVLNEIEAHHTNKIIGVHIKVDMGMGRQGAAPHTLKLLLKKIKATPCLKLEGIMAHFPMADDQQSDHSAQMTANFNKLIQNAGLDPKAMPAIHIANSAALFYVSEAKHDMVRPGIALYGYYPDEKNHPKEPLQPAMRFSSHVIQTREVPKGTGLGYGHSFITKRPTKLAIIPIGYDDGYLRNLSNKASVLIKGVRAPVVGRISMNLTLLDVTDCPPVSVGDEVVLLGKQKEEEITANEIANWMETISYEVLCLFGKMNNRHFVETF